MASFDREVIESQLSQIDLLMAMYPSSEELVLDLPTQQTISELRQWCDQDCPLPFRSTDSVQLALNVRVGEDTLQTQTVPLTVIVPLKAQVSNSEEAPSLRVRLRQPNWMSKAEVSEVMAKMPQDDDVLTAIEYVREEAFKYIKITDPSRPNSSLISKPITRAWFYFPSLSTREKRDDLVNHAPAYELTGFVLAGKPGVLCLEGPSSEIDSYMKYIKTESWGDIPSHQKKVSERYREQGNTITRAFTDMQEITDKLGEKRGERANRSDMKALESWLSDRGLGKAFEKVLM